MLYYRISIACELTFAGIPGKALCWGIPFGRYEYLPAHHYTSADAVQARTRSHQPSCVHWEQYSAQNEGKCCIVCPSDDPVVPT